MRSRLFSLLAMSWLCVACGDPEEQKPNPEDTQPKGPGTEAMNGFQKGSLANAEDAAYWARMGSAPNIYVVTLGPSLLNAGDADGTCPVKTTVDELTKRVVGNCTDKDGVEWVGSAEEKSSFTGLTTTYSGFGTVQNRVCEGKTAKERTAFTGTVVMGVTGPTSATPTQTFTVNLVMDKVAADSETCTETGLTTAVEYKGSVVGSPSTGTSESGPSTWNGAGRIGTSKAGFISVETKDEVTNSKVCAGEAASGKTLLSSDKNTVEITYDGATDCASSSTVQWSLNGAAQGKLEGIMCSAANGPTAAFWGAALFGALGLMRRRARN